MLTSHYDNNGSSNWRARVIIPIEAHHGYSSKMDLQFLFGNVNEDGELEDESVLDKVCLFQDLALRLYS